MPAMTTEIIERDVRELRASRAITHRPDAGCCRLEPLVHLDVAVVSQFDPGQFQTDVGGIGSASRCDEQM
jgi:hypothetical protein